MAMVLHPSTRLQLEGVAWSNLHFVNSRQFSFTLSGPADLTGKPVILTDANGAQSRYYSTLTPTYVRRAASVPVNVQPIFSQVAYSDAGLGYQPFALENPSVSPVDVTFQNYPLPVGRNPPPPPNTMKITIAAGALYVFDYQDMPLGNSGPVMFASAPCVWSRCAVRTRLNSPHPLRFLLLVELTSPFIQTMARSPLNGDPAIRRCLDFGLVV
jgi:hypothetical protein